MVGSVGLVSNKRTPQVRDVFGKLLSCWSDVQNSLRRWLKCFVLMESNQTTPHKVKQKSNCHVPPSIPTFFGDAIFSLNTNRQRDTKTVNSFFFSRLFTQGFHFSPPKKIHTTSNRLLKFKPRSLVTRDCGTGGLLGTGKTARRAAGTGHG